MEGHRPLPPQGLREALWSASDPVGAFHPQKAETGCEPFPSGIILLCKIISLRLAHSKAAAPQARAGLIAGQHIVLALRERAWCRVMHRIFKGKVIVSGK
jgi:hypothetical protein